MGTVVVYSKVPETLEELKAAVARALEICGGTAERYAKEECPVDTGNLRNSITHYQEGENTEVIGTSVYYAPFVELGHHQQPGRFVPKLKKRLVASWVNGKPFLRPVIQDHNDEYSRIIEGELGG